MKKTAIGIAAFVAIIVAGAAFAADTAPTPVAPATAGTAAPAATAPATTGQKNMAPPASAAASPAVHQSMPFYEKAYRKVMSWL